MAEVIGIIGSIIAVATVTTQLSRSLHGIAKSIGSAGDDIEKFAMNTADFSALMRLAHTSLDSHCAKLSAQSSSDTFRQITEGGVLEQLLEHCKLINKWIAQLKPRLKSLRSNIALVSRVKWYFQKSDVKDLGNEMDSMKASIQLMLSIVSIEFARIENKPPAVLYGARSWFSRILLICYIEKICYSSLRKS
jgi:hypothetical protein